MTLDTVLVGLGLGVLVAPVMAATRYGQRSHRPCRGCGRESKRVAGGFAWCLPCLDDLNPDDAPHHRHPV